jgi:hypothetical protein
MWTRRLTNLFLGLYARPGFRVAFLTLYYLAIIAGLILMYGKGDFSTPKFIYQGF